MKRLLILSVCLIILLNFVMSAFSADIDGFDMGTEWDEAVSYKLVDGESNCRVNFGVVKAKFDNENNAVFLCFMFIDPSLEQDNMSAGVSISVDYSSSFLLTMSNTPQNSDIDRFSFDGAMSIDSNNGATCEVRIGFKSGLPQKIECQARFIDSEGEPSSYYNFTLINEGYIETTVIEIAPTKDNTDPLYNSEALTVKTTKKKTSNYKAYTKKSSKTTAKSTKKTTKKTTTTRWEIEDSPMIYTGRTKTTNKKSEDSYVEKTVVEAPAGVTVYYYEKEVIISQVVVTQTKAEATTNLTTTSSAELQNNSTSSEISTGEMSSSTALTLSKGTKLKKISTLIGAVLFCVIASLGAYYSKNKKSQSESED